MAAVAALYAWYTRIKIARKQRERSRPRTQAERDAELDRILQEMLRDEGLIPLETVKNRGLRERLGLNRGMIPVPDPIKNRQPRRSNRSSGTTQNARPVQPSSQRGHDSWPSPRPNSTHTTASSSGQGSINSPLSPSPWSPISPPLPVIPSSPQTPNASRPTRAQRSDSTTPAPHPRSFPLQPTISPLPRALRSHRILHSDNTSLSRPSADSTRLPLPVCPVLRSETQSSLKFYKDEQIAMEQMREALRKKGSASSLCESTAASQKG